MAEKRYRAAVIFACVAIAVVVAQTWRRSHPVVREPVEDRRGWPRRRLLISDQRPNSLHELRQQVRTFWLRYETLEPTRRRLLDSVDDAIEQQRSEPGTVR